MTTSTEPDATTTETTSPRRFSPRRLVLLVIGSLLLTGLFAYVMDRGALRALPSDVDIHSVGVLNIGIFSAIWLVVILLKALRWHWQLQPIADVPIRRVLSASILGFAAVLVLPFRSGEVMRPALITRGTRVSFFAAVSTSATERIIDAVFASSILIVSLLNAEVISPLPSQIGELPVPTQVVPVLGYSAAAVSITAVLAAFGFYAFQERAQWLIRQTLGRVWRRGAEWLERSLSEFARGLAFLVSSRHASRFLLVSIGYWGTYWLSTWFLLSNTGFAGASFAQTGVIVGTLAFGMSLPNAPGFFGSFQMAVYASLALFYPADRVQSDGSVFVFWLYALQLGWVFALAPLAYLSERHSRSHSADPEP